MAVTPNPHRKSLIMLKSEHVLAHLSNKNGGSSMGIYELNEEMRHDFAENYQQLNPLLHRSHQHQQPPRQQQKPRTTSYFPKAATASVAEIRYPDFDQWLQTAGNISYVTSVMLARSKSESTLSEMSDMTSNKRKIFSLSKKPQRRSRLNYHDLGKSHLRDGIRQHHIALLRWTSLVGRLSKVLSSAFSEFSKKLELAATELRAETEKTNRLFRTENHVKNAKPTFVLGRTLDKIWLTVLDNVSDQARIFGDLSKTMTIDFAPSFTELIDHHQKFIGQIYAFECGLEQLLTEYRQSTQKSYEAAEVAKTLALTPSENKPRSGLGSLTFAVEAQNNYVLNLHNYNTMCGQYETQLMPVLVEEMEEASTDLMTYGVKFLEAITQLIGKRYGELKGRMEVVEYACRYQSKARSDISAYVRAFLDGKPGQQQQVTTSPVVTFVPIPVTPKNQLLTVNDDDHKLVEMADAISEEIYDMADLRRSKQIELERLEERYHQCLANANVVLQTGTNDGTPTKSNSKGQSSSGAKESLPSFSTVTFQLKENIADARRMVALASAKLDSLKHQMDMLSAARRSALNVNEEPPRPSTSSNNNSRPPRLPHQSGGKAVVAVAAATASGGGGNKPRGSGLRRSLTQWFSFLALSNGQATGEFRPNITKSKKTAIHSASAAALGGNITPDDSEKSGEDDDDDEEEEEQPVNIKRRSTPVQRSSRHVDEEEEEDDYYYGYEGNDDAEDDHHAEAQSKQKTKIFSVKGFKKTIDRLRRMASEESSSTVVKRRRNPHRMQSHEPDPVYALLKCAARLSNVNLEAHAGNCTCDECPARRLVNGLSSSMALPTSLVLALPGGHAHSFNDSEAALKHQQQQQMSASLLDVDHPAMWALGSMRPERHRLSSTSKSGASSTSPSSGQPPQLIRSSSTLITTQTSSTPVNSSPYYQQQTNYRR